MIFKTEQKPPNDPQKYLDFLAKFEDPKTTDDCYTPPRIYEAVRNFVQKNCNIEGLEIVRPFYPNGNYQNEDYTNAVVVDNPPFSILSEILDFYLKNNIKFFLFAPYLTAFNYNHKAVSFVVVDTEITYQNGAKVKTCFVTNLLGDLQVWGSQELNEAFKEIRASERVSLPKYEYPPEVLTMSRIGRWVNAGQEVKFFRGEMLSVRQLDSQKPHRKTIYSKGFLLGAEGLARAEALKRENLDFVWRLSDRERNLISLLNKNHP